MNATLGLAIDSAHDLQFEVQIDLSNERSNLDNPDRAIQQLVKSVNS